MSIDELRMRAQGLSKKPPSMLSCVSSQSSSRGGYRSLGLVQEASSQQGLRLIQGGRFHTVSGLHDKGGASTGSPAFFASLWHESIHVLALGDGPNDLSMLDAADRAICVRSPAHPPLVGSRGAYSTTQLEDPRAGMRAYDFCKLKTNPSSEEMTFKTASDSLEDLTITA